jgi:hypothetical protein
MSKLLAWLDARINALVKNYTLWIMLGLILVVVLALVAYRTVFPRLPSPAVYASLHMLDQGWTPAQRERYYQTSQGTLVVPYSWYLALESQPSGLTGSYIRTALFSSPDVQARYGLLPDASQYNPDLLPVGIVRDASDRNLGLLREGIREWASISCAACHTGQFTYRGQAVRIDGGQSMWNFAQWSSDLVSNLVLTTIVPSRFQRFAARVLKREGQCPTPAGLQRVHSQMRVYFDSALIRGAINALLAHTYPVPEGNGRTAALGRGLNGEVGLLDPRNIRRSRSPVSFPQLWHTHEFDWVQSVAAIQQPMGRNITESWGVSMRVEIDDPTHRFESTARMREMFWMETLLSVLKPPPWPEPILGKIDPQKVERGRFLYEKAVWTQAPNPWDEQLPTDTAHFIAGPNPGRSKTGYCARCHGPAYYAADSYGPGRSYVQLPLYRLGVLGTDPTVAQEFAAREPYTGPLAYAFGGRTRVTGPETLTVATSGIAKRWYDDQQVSEACREIMNGFRPNHFRSPLGYPARPLAGYWATGPYLHNGSVRTLYQLLGPAAERETAFWVGSFEYDPVHLGYQNRPIEGATQFDTGIEGNDNTGHEFRDAPAGAPGVVGPALSTADRLAILEYLKVMDDVQIDPQELQRRQTLLGAMKDDYEGKVGDEESAGSTMVELCKKLTAAQPPPAPAPAQAGAAPPSAGAVARPAAASPSSAGAIAPPAPPPAP